MKFSQQFLLILLITIRVKYHYKTKLTQMTKIESLYHELLKKEVVTSEEIQKIASNILGKERSFRYIYNEYIKKLKGSGKLLHPRRGLYVAVPPQNIYENSFQPDRYLMASKIREPYYLGFHTALEIHGVAYSSYDEVYIVVPPEKRFTPFEFKQVSYSPAFDSSNRTGIKKMTHKGQELVVSSPSRTFLDCIDRPRYAGGWEECLKSLESLGGVKSKDIKNILDERQKDMLYRKTGFILSLFDENPYYEGILSQIKPYLKENIGDYPMYLNKSSKNEFDEEWNLYVPSGFEDILKGI